MDQGAKKLLLLSNSTQHGRGYLDHAEDQIRSFFPAGSEILFVPYAFRDHAGYARVAGPRFEAMGYRFESIHTAADPVRAVENAGGVFVGGGNTFRLLKTLCDNRLLQPIRTRVEQGMPYMGASAGTVVACPTIRTTNDMPIVEPPSLSALALTWFQINCHYLDPDPASTHMGETRETRLREFHEENELPVVGLREGDMLRIENGSVMLSGRRGARIFRREQPPVEVAPGSELNSYLQEGAP